MSAAPSPHASATPPAPEQRGTASNWTLLGMAVVMTLPWIFLALAGPRDAHGYSSLSPAVVASFSGLAILGAAFLLSWAAEVAQLDMSQALALVILSLIAILPEYSVDMAFAWQAGKGWAAQQDPNTTLSPEQIKRLLDNVHYAVANMTGANRLLIGIAWSGVVFIHCWRARARDIKVEASRSIEIKYLLLATLYSFSLPIKAAWFGIGLHWIDALVLVTLFGFYTRAASQTEHVEPELVGPPAAIAALPVKARRTLCIVLFVFAAGAIFLAAHPFAESLVSVGRTYKINEFLLVQWIAPLASEMPEFIVAGLFAWRGFPTMGIGTLISSKVNQWTLLVGLLPIFYGLAAGQAVPLSLDAQQRSEVLLTSAQSLFAVAILLNFSISLWEAAGLLSLFLIQAITQLAINLRITDPDVAGNLTQITQHTYAAIYILLAVWIIFADRERRNILKTMFRGGVPQDHLETQPAA